MMLREKALAAASEARKLTDRNQLKIEAEGREKRVAVFYNLMQTLLEEAGYRMEYVPEDCEITIDGLRIGLIDLNYEAMDKIAAIRKSGSIFDNASYVWRENAFTLALLATCPYCRQEIHGAHITNLCSLGVVLESQFKPCSHKCPLVI